MYEVFEHTADLGLRAQADDLDSLFAEAGKALFSVIVGNLEDVRPIEERKLTIAGDDREYLLFDWLSELLYLFETQHMLWSEFDVHVGDEGLEAVIRGEPTDPARHRLEHEVKAITYHELKVIKQPQGWMAEVLVDI